MNDEPQDRVAQLDDKQAIHYLNLVANGVVETPDESLLAIRGMALEAKLNFPQDLTGDPENTILEGHEAGELARALLKSVANSAGGAEIVEAVLQQRPSTTADFGIVSGAVLLVVAWLAVSGRTKVKVGGLEYEKDGLKSADQTRILQHLLPGLLKAIT